MGGRPARPEGVRGGAPGRITGVRAVGQLRRLPRVASPVGLTTDTDRRTSEHRSPKPAGNSSASVSTPWPASPSATPPSLTREPLRCYPVTDFAGLAKVVADRDVHMLDTRRNNERARVAIRWVAAHPTARTRATGSTKCPTARCGSTAAPATAPPSPPPSWTARVAGRAHRRQLRLSQERRTRELDRASALTRHSWHTHHPHQLREEINDERTPAEFDTAHIRGSYNVPLGLLDEHADQLHARVDHQVVLVCRPARIAAW